MSEKSATSMNANARSVSESARLRLRSQDLQEQPQAVRRVPVQSITLQ
jgi:hypothetical protein